jgi:flavin reductase (DIM6/NTAB) family NADH-FMN oxidoreductase RutF
MKLEENKFYSLTVRPTVVVSTISPSGISNAAPFSFNSPVSIDPPLFGISSQVTHDTWKNIRENGEFVVNLVGARFGPLLKILEADYPYEVSEIGEAGLTEEKSKLVKPPRIKEAYGWLECRMNHNVSLGDHVWIVGDVLLAEVRDELYDTVLIAEKAHPLSHIFKDYFVHDMKRSQFERAKK